MAAPQPPEALLAAAEPASPLVARLPGWIRLVRAANPGPMTLDGTNTWVLRAPDQSACILADPGPLDEAHLAALVELAPVGVILITHGHPDHVGGLARLVELLGQPSGSSSPGVPPGVIRAGESGLDQPEQLFGFTVTMMATPGHTSDSVSYLVEPAGRSGDAVVLTGDTILGRGSTVVAYPDGDLGDYLASLARLARLGPRPVLPGHGPALADCATAARHYLAHRHARLAQVREARAAGAASAAEVVALVYADVDRALWWAAELSVRAQLAYLDRESSPGGGERMR